MIFLQITRNGNWNGRHHLLCRIGAKRFAAPGEKLQQVDSVSTSFGNTLLHHCMERLHHNREVEFWCLQFGGYEFYLIDISVDGGGNELNFYYRLH